MTAESSATAAARNSAIEQALLLSNWSDNDISLPLSPVETLLQHICHGRYSQLLTSKLVRSLQLFRLATDDAGRPIVSLASQQEPKEWIMLAVGIALLQAFVQTNWTGPEVDLSPLDLIDSAPEGVSESALNDAAVAALSLAGEPAYHLARKTSFLLIARELVAQPSSIPSIALWRLRAGIVHLQLLDEPVPLPDPTLLAVERYRDVVLASLPDSDERQDLIATVSLELGLYYSLISQNQPTATRAASDLFLRAATDTKLEYKLTGRLGKRTKFQQKETSQLLVLAQSRPRQLWQPRTQTKAGETNGAVPDMPEVHALNDDTLLERTKYTATSDESAQSALDALDPSQQPALHPLDQSILLALCLNISNTSPAHGLTTLQMGAFVTRVLDHPENWTIYSMGLLIRSRLEASRSRTVERGLLQMQSLVDQLRLEGSDVERPPPEDDHIIEREKGAPVQERLQYVYDVAAPARWHLEAELAKRFLGLGVVKSALEIFIRLEMWEDAVKCWQAIEQQPKGIAVVKDLLEGRKEQSDEVGLRIKGKISDKARQAKLWCLLGDLEANADHYRKAWELSGKTSSRAMRSLGVMLFTRKDYPGTIEALRKALAINPLFVRSWFVLGCAAMMSTDWPTAEEAFARCVSLDDEDGECWSNLASIHLRRTEEAATGSATAPTELGDEAIYDTGKVPYSRKRAAYGCLRQAVRYSYDSWRVWQNFMIVSVDVGELTDAARALGKLVELRADKVGDEAIDFEVLERLVNAVTRGKSYAELSAPPVDNSDETDVGPNSSRALWPRVKDLFERTLLPRISSAPRLFLAYANLLYWAGDLKGSIDAHLKAYRCSSAVKDEAASQQSVFITAAQEVLDVVDVLRNMGSKEVDGQLVLADWRYQAKSIVRTFLARTRTNFEEEPAWQSLNEELQDLKS
ncbi:uncharacterized protein L969DRAFT_96458 [Mixia osmundae IAM 14324]|nr:uncharacterized protein L969DRAFT_96458 [Mixia osmundae IAM 14324]KEI37379.1 hypothetical protein L969DRAFT_96458 [Mixia osmundae IAM 14324]